MISITTTIDSNLAKVWECWTRPEHITQWNFASEDWCCPTAQNNLQVGGTFTSRMEAKDGSMGFDFEGKYLEVVPQKTIIYTIADGRKVTIELSESANGVELVESFETEDTHTEEQQRAGWQAILDNFKKYVESI
ncbi:SRPBCC family protein [Allomuricauda sp. NBRC 101325]|uniref:SRPBCC family protein n=1 Tax=Allomuricauda sp. NBRC 101325 TaxID=1113758 RepID=UPI0025529C0B|nr:SRPBCC family protein [Muricauda sp. NBRC 101325]